MGRRTLITATWCTLLMALGVLPQPPGPRAGHARAPGRPLLRVEQRSQLPPSVARDKETTTPATMTNSPAAARDDALADLAVLTRRMVEEEDLPGLARLLRLFVECRQVWVRNAILRGIQTSRVETHAIDWIWLSANCPRGAEGVAARIAMKAGLDRYGGQMWKDRLADPHARRDVEETLAEGP